MISKEEIMLEENNIFEIKNASGIIDETTEIKNPNAWTKSEDNILFLLISEDSRKSWKTVAQVLKNKTPIQCYYRYNSKNPYIKKGRWTSIEDEKILNLIKIHGKNWADIAKEFSTRTGKQIRDRYLNKLDTKINHNKFTHKEDQTILNYYKIYGPKWAKIAKCFPDRTSDMIKSRFHSSIKRKTIFYSENYDSFSNNYNFNNGLNQSNNTSPETPTHFSNIDNHGSYSNNTGGFKNNINYCTDLQIANILNFQIN